jgi:glycosyltransferase involved in cell wall biosynthesis
MTFAEAMASGLPLLARKDEVLENLLIEGKTGWYFTDAEDLAEKLAMIMKMDEADLAQMKADALVQIQPLSLQLVKFLLLGGVGCLQLFAGHLGICSHRIIVLSVVIETNYSIV